MSEVCSGEQTFAQLRTGLTLSTETIRLIRDGSHPFANKSTNPATLQICEPVWPSGKALGW